MTKIIANDAGGGSTFKPVSEGLHPAVCVGVVDLGIQPGSDRFPKPKHKVYLKWACVDETVSWEKDGQQKTGPAIVGSSYTLSLGENARLRPLLESWRGRKFTEEERKGFDVAKLAGVPCRIQVLHEERAGKVYATISSIVPWPKGVQPPKLDEPPVIYSPSEHNPAVYNDLPQWLRKQIDARLANSYEEYDTKPEAKNALVPEGGYSAPTEDDDIPF